MCAKCRHLDLCMWPMYLPYSGPEAQGKACHTTLWQVSTSGTWAQHGQWLWGMMMCHLSHLVWCTVSATSISIAQQCIHCTTSSISSVQPVYPLHNQYIQKSITPGISGVYHIQLGCSLLLLVQLESWKTHQDKPVAKGDWRGQTTPPPSGWRATFCPA